MRARAVTTEQDLEALRQIRNSGREWMTRDTAEISPEQQAAWWAARDPETCMVFLFSHQDTDIGYGMLRRIDDYWWCSLAVLPHKRGQGYGEQIYRWLGATEGAVWAEIAATNTPSLIAALRAGFELIEMKGPVAMLVHRR
jgi:GNAT superfamily N-acetyltransferase